MLIKLLVSQNFFWPNYFKEFKDFVRTCNKCQKEDKAGEKTLLKLVPVISEVFAKINVDASESLPVTSTGKKYIITQPCVYYPSIQMPLLF